jgi:HEAT repeat protein
MLDPGSELALPWPMAFAVLLGSVTLAVFFARAYARRERRQVRQRARDLQRDIAAYLDGRLGAHALREALADVDPGVFWSAIEAFAARLPRVEWLHFSKGLEKAPQLRAERRALHDDSPWRGELAARRLALVRSRASRTALRRAMVAGPELLSFACARALARYGDRRALRWLLDHPERLDRRSAKQWTALLGGFGPTAFPLLLAGLDHVKDRPALERAMVEALGQIGDPAAAAAIERRLAHGDMDMRVSAARALGRLRAVAFASGLIAALKDEAWQVRAQAAWALGQARAPIAVYALTSRLADRSWWVRRHAAYALAEFGEEGLAALNHAAQHSEDRYARDIAAEVLAGGMQQRVA